MQMVETINVYIYCRHKNVFTNGTGAHGEGNNRAVESKKTNRNRTNDSDHHNNIQGEVAGSGRVRPITFAGVAVTADSDQLVKYVM